MGVVVIVKGGWGGMGGGDGGDEGGEEMGGVVCCGGWGMCVWVKGGEGMKVSVGEGGVGVLVFEEGVEGGLGVGVEELRGVEGVGDGDVVFVIVIGVG